jgi:hypothetical protein
MTGYTPLDVALGLVFVYTVLSLACSALNETISSVFAWRAKFLREGIANLVAPSNHADGLAIVEQIYGHPLVNALIRPSKPGGKARYPSYLPARTFVTALLDLDGTGAGKSLRKAIERVPSAEVQRALTTLLEEAEGDAERFKKSAEQWFDSAMERVSGWYRRRVQIVMWVLAAAIVLALNADTVGIAQRLWTDKTLRDAVVARAQSAAAQPDGVNAVATDVGGLEKLSIPLGWKIEHAPSSTGGWAELVALKSLGLLLTAAALTLGAPFWFDVLGKIARLRSSGDPPPRAAPAKGE